ncbi:spermidine synthase [Gammaproteobacteria bacterium]
MMGGIYFANILGSTASVLLTGFVLMNVLSIREMTNYLFAVGIIAALIPLVISQSITRKALIVHCVSLFCFTGVIFFSSNLFFHHFYEKLLFKTNYAQNPPLKYVVENNAGVIAVAQNDEVFGGGVYDGYFNIDPRHNLNGIWRAYAIPLFSQHPQNVLMIGLSSGSWAQVVANNPDVKRLTIVEINPGYLKLISKYNEISSLLVNPKVNVIIDDGRRWLARNKNKKYDLIVMNATFYWRSYTPFLLSKDFFQLIQQHLTDIGVFYFNTTSSLDAVKTVRSVFPHVNTLYNFAIASSKPLQFDAENLKKHLLSYTINNKKIFDLNNAIDRITIEEIMAIQKRGIVNQQTLEKTTKNAKIITDDTFLICSGVS